jgi:peptidoglycan/xylan/chitin deacetylase (PgdA/CDA1 family)
MEPAARRAGTALVVAVVAMLLAGCSLVSDRFGDDLADAATSTGEHSGEVGELTDGRPLVTPTTRDPRTPTGPVATVTAVDGRAPIISRVETTDPVIFVTIDDGLVPDPRVLDLLTRTGMPVTMFLNETPVLEHPEYFDALRALGNSVNSHTLDHADVTTLGADGQRREICGMVELLRTTYGNEGGFFRAPYGFVNASAQQQAASCGIRAVLSWMGTLNGGQLQLQQPTLQPGDIILTHFQDDLYDNLLEIQRRADEAGLTIARVEEYLPAP